jgi:hypothetical protein
VITRLQNLVLAAALVFGCGIAVAETPAKIGPEEASISNPGITISDWHHPCTADTSSDCGTNTAYVGSPAAGDEGKLRFICEASHLLYDDPILNSGNPGWAHLHHFFGNASTNAYSTYRSLRQTTVAGTCDGGPLNNTGYWFPAMINGGQNKVQVPDFIEMYYNVLRGDLSDYVSPLCPDNGGWPYHGNGPQIACTTKAATRMERGLKFIVGRLASTGALPSSYPSHRSGSTLTNPFTWSCGGVGPKQVFWDRSTPSNGVQGCSSSTTLQVRLEAPNCWDGLYSSSNQFNQLSYDVDDNYSGLACPATHPYRIPRLTVIIAWSHNGEADYSTWYLSSDRYNGADLEGGKGFHTDWFGGWEDEIQDGWHQEINGMHPGSLPYTTPSTSTHVRESVDGGLGNGFQLDNTTTTTTATGEPARYADIPTQLKSGGKGIRRGRGHVR